MIREKRGRCRIPLAPQLSKNLTYEDVSAVVAQYTAERALTSREVRFSFCSRTESYAHRVFQTEDNCGESPRTAPDCAEFATPLRDITRQPAAVAAESFEHSLQK